MKMLEAVEASPQGRAIMKDPEGRGWWKGFSDGTYALIDPEGEEVKDAPLGTLINLNNWIPVMDLTGTGSPEVLWESSIAVWETKKLRREVDLLKVYTAHQGMMIESLIKIFYELSSNPGRVGNNTALKKLQELSEELRQLDKEV